MEPASSDLRLPTEREANVRRDRWDVGIEEPLYPIDAASRPWGMLAETAVREDNGAKEISPAKLKTASILLEEIKTRHLKAPLATRVALFDDLQGGGLSRGTLIELTGGRSSGRFALALAALAAATQAGEDSALVDLGDHLDPACAEAAGVDLSRLLWVRPTRLRDALASAEMLLATGFSLVVLDLGFDRGTDVPRTAWYRLARSAEDHDNMLFVVAPVSLHTTAADAVVVLQRPRPAWLGEGPSPRIFSGLTSRLNIQKRHVGLRTGRLSFGPPERFH